MNEQHEYLPVPEFAKKAKVSASAVYSRIDKGSINEFVKIIGGRKHVSVEALPYFRQNKSEVDCQEQTTSQNNLTEVEKQVDCQEQSTSDNLIVELTEHVKALNQQVEILIRQNKEKDEKLIEYADKFAALAEKAINTTGQAQLLHAHAVVEEEPETVISEPDTETTELKKEQSKIVKFVSRIFKRE